MAEGKIDLDDLLQPTNKQPDGNLEEEETEVNISDKNLLSYCLECRRTRSLPDPDACIFLHAWKYKSEFWEYSTEFPSWAST